ncbi:MAG: hypothetical protein AAGJ46_01570 [Planctomycetota bacterium]
MQANAAPRFFPRLAARWLATAVLAFAPPAAAEQGELTKLVEVAGAASNEVRPVRADEVETAKRQLADRAVTLERAVGIGTVSGAEWLEFLQWRGVQQQLPLEAELDAASLQATLDLLSSGHPGLERPEFRNAADAVDRLLDLALVQRRQDQQAYLSGLAKSLEKLLARSKAWDDPRASYQIEQRYARLAGVGQASELTAAIRSAFNRPNAYAEASESFLGKLAQRPVARTTPVSDTILGTRVVGAGETCGYIRLDLRPATHAARLAFHLDGSVASTTRGYNGPVVIRTAADTSFNGAKVVDLTDDRFTVLPASLSASTSSRTRSIQKLGGPFGKRLVEAIAAKRVAQSRGEANAIASRKAEAQIATEFDREVLAEVRGARREYDQRVRKPLRRRGAAPRRVALATTNDRLFGSGLLATRRQLGADGRPPSSSGGDVCVKLHQSALNNLADAMLGGATIGRQAVDQPIETDAYLPARLAAALTERSKSPDDESVEDFQPWSITLRRSRPVSFSLDGDVARVLVHTTRLKAGEQSFRGWDIELAYRLVRKGGSWRAVLEGDVEVLPTAFDPASPGARMGSRQRALRRNLADQLAARTTAGAGFPKSIKLQAIDLARLNKPGLRGLAITSAEATGGWLLVSLAAF